MRTLDGIASLGLDYVLRDFRMNFLWWLPYFVGTTLALIEAIFSLRRANSVSKRAA